LLFHEIIDFTGYVGTFQDTAVAHKQNLVHNFIYKIPQITNFANLLAKPQTIWQNPIQFGKTKLFGKSR